MPFKCINIFNVFFYIYKKIWLIDSDILPFSVYPLASWTYLDLKILRPTALNSSALIMLMSNYSITATSAYLHSNKWDFVFVALRVICLIVVDGNVICFLRFLLLLCFRRNIWQKESHGTPLTSMTTLAASVSSARNPLDCFFYLMRRASEFRPIKYGFLNI